MTTLRFAAIGLDHDHIYAMCAALMRGGAELVAERAEWFFDPARHGGILNDIASHQLDQLLHLAGTLDWEIVAAHVANRGHAGRAGFQDVGECLVRAGGLTGDVRVDWFTPDGLPVFGDGRLVLIGTEGTLEPRRYVDLASAPGGDHLILVDRSGVRRLPVDDVTLRFGTELVSDLCRRTEHAISQAHVLAVCRLALAALSAGAAKGMTARGAGV